jgi:small subunit ribosomal protein S20
MNRALAHRDAPKQIQDEKKWQRINHRKNAPGKLSSDMGAATKAQRAAESALARGAGRGTLHWKTAARKTSRLAKRVKALKKG